MKEIIIWGTGKTLQEYKHLFYDMKILYYCNNEVKTEPQYIDGIRVIDPDEIIGKIKEHPKLKIMIVSIWEQAIYQQCVDMGLGDYVVPFYCRRNLHYTHANDDFIYYAGLYDDYYRKVDEHYSREYLPCNVLKKGETRVLQAGKEQFFALKALEEDTNIEIRTNENTYRKKLDSDHFEYFKKDKKDAFVINSDKEIAISKIWDRERNCKGKLILHVIFDSMLQNVIEHRQQELMPNTYQYFRNGVSFENCYCCADWTMPAVATIETGEYPIMHRLLDPKKMQCFKGQSLPERARETGGWFNVCMGSNTHAEPPFGYLRGLDRMIYVFGYYRGAVMELFPNLLETVRACRDKNLFLTLHVFDLHHNLKGLTDVGEQIDLPLGSHFYVDEYEGKSVFANFNSDQQEMYIQRAKRLDYYLGTLYSFLDKEYGDDCSVIFSADHGKPIVMELDKIHKLDGIDRRLADRMTKVPLYVKSKGLKGETIPDVTDNTVIYKIISAYLDEENVNNEMIHDLSKKEFAYNESIYPQQTYVAEVIDENYRFYFETEDLVDDDCRILGGKFKARLFERVSGKEIADENQKQRFIDIVMEHISRQDKEFS